MTSCAITYPTVNTILPFFQLAEQISDNGQAIWNENGFLMFYKDQTNTSYCEYKIGQSILAGIVIKGKGSCGVSFPNVKKILQTFPKDGELVITYTEIEISFVCKTKSGNLSLTLKALFLDVDQLEIDHKNYELKASIQPTILQDLINPLVFYGGDIEITIDDPQSLIKLRSIGDQGEGNTEAFAVVYKQNENSKKVMTASFSVTLIKKLVDGLAKNHTSLSIQIMKNGTLGFYAMSQSADTFIVVAPKIEDK